MSEFEEHRSTSTTHCPSDHEWEQLLLGQLPSDQEQRLEDHITECEFCRGRLGERTLGEDASKIDRLIQVYRRRQQDTTRSESLANSTHPEGNQPEGPRRTSESREAVPSLPGYEIHEELARGGMGVVFRATHKGLGRPVAIKMIVSGLLAGPERIARFMEEAKTVAKLDHPNIVKVFDVGDHGGHPFFSMELIDGHSLRSMFQGTPWAPDRATNLVQALASAIEFAHRNGIVHRDLKPANILIRPSETDPDSPLIVDFGLAKNLNASELTMTGEALGTPCYMAPEQACGQNDQIGPGSDIYSLGCILYELLTGRPPFRAASIAETLNQIIADPPASPRSLNASIPLDLETICLKCLHKEPGRRYTTAAELAADLVRFQEGHPIRARRTPHWERGLKWCRRHPSLAVLGLVTLVATTSLLVMWITFTSDLAEQTAIAKRQSEKAQRNAELAKQNEITANQNERIANENALKAELSAELQIEGMSFLNDMTYELSTLGSQDKLANAILEAEQKINPRLHNRPLPMAAYLLAMGNTLGQIGQHQKALEVVTQAEDIFEKFLGANSKNTTRAKLLRLDLLINLRRLAEARELVSSLDSSGSEFFRYDQRQLRLLSANLHCNEGNYDSAIEEMTEFLRFITGQKETNLEYFMQAHGILGVAFSHQGEFEKAGEHFALRLDYTRDNYPEGHYAVLWAENTYGVYLANTGRAVEAAELLRKSLDLSIEKLGEKHKNTIELMQNLASALSRSKQYEESSPLFKKAIEWNLNQFGQAHPLTMGAMINLTVDFLDRKEFEEGFTYLQEHCIVEDLVNSPGNYSGRLVVYYAKVCLGAGQWDQAEKLLEDLEKIVDSIDKPDPYLINFLKTAPQQLNRLRSKSKSDSASKPQGGGPC